MKTALKIDNLVMRYPQTGLFKRGLSDVAAVDGVSLEVRSGEVLGIIGESGSGKTTLVRAALGLLPYQNGRVEVLGQDIQALTQTELRQSRRRFQLLFQDPAAMLNPGMTVQEHLMESARVHEVPDPHAIVGTMSAQVGLAHRMQALPQSLSGGEKRRVGLARVLIPKPALLVADEPTAGLDAALKADLIDAIVSHRDAESAVVVISHDLPMVAYACDRIVVMLNGKIVDRFEASEMGKIHHHSYTRQLLVASGLLVGADTHECARKES